MQGWLSVCSCVTVYAPSSLLCGLLLTCRVVERCVDVLCRDYGWFSERIDAVIGCSGSLMYAYLTNIKILCTFKYFISVNMMGSHHA